VSKQPGQRELTVCRRSDGSESFDGVHATRRRPTDLAVHLLLTGALRSDSAGPRLHRCNGRVLTPQEGGPAPSEREQDDEHSQQDSIT